MKRRLPNRRLWGSGIILLLLWAFAPLAQAQDGAGQAGVVVVGGDGDVTTACVAAGAAENGLELLAASAIPHVAATNSFGATVCSVNGTGCPAEDCWCQCQGGGECVYWSLWQQVEGQWQYANVGATQLPVSAGTIHGWSWGPGTPGAAPEPPPLTLAEICAAPAAAAATSPAATMTPAAATTAPAGTSPALLLGGGVALLLIGLLLVGLLARRSGAEPHA